MRVIQRTGSSLFVDLLGDDDGTIAPHGAKVDERSANLGPIAEDKLECRSTDATQNLDSVC